jgi:DNA-binding PadR family transcriptional regulator
MNEVSFLVLTSLAGGPRHGYGMLQEIEELAGPGERPQVATLYRTIDRLAADGLIEEHESEVVGGRFRRSYRLTERGLAVLSDEAARRASTAKVALRRLRRLRGTGALQSLGQVS